MTEDNPIYGVYLLLVNNGIVVNLYDTNDAIIVYPDPGSGLPLYYYEKLL